MSDLIERQAVIDLLHGETEETYITSNGRITYRIAEINVDDLMSIPSVTTQQKTGKWLHFAQSDECSVCGYNTGKYESPSKYCPNCGAKLEVEE